MKADLFETATAFVTSTKYFKLAESLGCIKSLLCHPAAMTHKSIPQDIRRASGVSDSLIRLSIGLEDVQDLIIDLEQAFELTTHNLPAGRQASQFTTAPHVN